MPSIHDVIQEAADLLVSQAREKVPDAHEINRSNLLRAALMIGLEELVAAKDPATVRSAVLTYVAAKRGVLPPGSPLGGRLDPVGED